MKSLSAEEAMLLRLAVRALVTLLPDLSVRGRRLLHVVGATVLHLIPDHRLSSSRRAVRAMQ